MTTSFSERSDVPIDHLSLARLQRWMQSSISHPDGVIDGINSDESRASIDISAENVETVITRSQALTATERLSLYGYAYHARLVDCLREIFPIVAHALEDELFQVFAVEYLRRYPSRAYTLMQLGERFPAFLAESREELDADDPSNGAWLDFLTDLATFELTCNEVFDGEGSEGEPAFDIDELRAINPEIFLASRLRCAPSLRLLELRYPVHRYYEAVRKGETPVLPEPTTTFLAVNRRDYVVRHHELWHAGFTLLQSLLRGESISQAIRRASETGQSDDGNLSTSLRSWFAEWAAAAFFQRIDAEDIHEVR